jgi:hypothetical protein
MTSPIQCISARIREIGLAVILTASLYGGTGAFIATIRLGQGYRSL